VFESFGSPMRRGGGRTPLHSSPPRMFYPACPPGPLSRAEGARRNFSDFLPRSPHSALTRYAVILCRRDDGIRPCVCEIDRISVIHATRATAFSQMASGGDSHAAPAPASVPTIAPNPMQVYAVAAQPPSREVSRRRGSSNFHFNPPPSPLEPRQLSGLVQHRSAALTTTGFTFLGFMLALVALAGNHQWFSASLSSTATGEAPMGQKRCPAVPWLVLPFAHAVSSTTTYITNVLTGSLTYTSCQGCECMQRQCVAMPFVAVLHA